FNPKSKEVLKNLNAEKRASLENEREEMTEIKNSNKEQVIEKEIEKGTENISSSELITTNNIDYYENEEVEIIKSRGRR
nr:helicase [Helicobacter pylori]